MISFRVLAILAIVGVLLLGTSACAETGPTSVGDLCKGDMDCPVTMRCDPATQRCVECLEDEDCPAPWRCDRAPAICVECLEDQDCLHGSRCVEKKCVAIQVPSEEGDEAVTEPEPEEPNDTPTATATATATASPTPTATPTATPTTPLPEEESVLPQLAEFQENYNAAITSGDVESVVGLLCPVVIDAFGSNQCSDYIQQSMVDPVRRIEIVEATAIGTWRWEMDGASIVVEGAIRARANLIDQNQTTEEELYFTEPGDKVCWFVDCGDAEAERSPSLPSEGTWLMVINHCAASVFFTIADQMYEVPGNSHVLIELEPQEYTYTVSHARCSSNGIVNIEPDVITGIPIQCEVSTDQPSDRDECP